jgi:hypothetical protein
VFHRCTHTSRFITCHPAPRYCACCSELALVYRVTTALYMSHSELDGFPKIVPLHLVMYEGAVGCSDCLLSAWHGVTNIGRAALLYTCHGTLSLTNAKHCGYINLLFEIRVIVYHRPNKLDPCVTPLFLTLLTLPSRNLCLYHTQ